MKQRFIRVAFMLACMLLLLPVQVFANSPPPPEWFTVDLRNLPEGTAYVDLLIYLPESDPHYTELEEANLPEGFSAQAEIVVYCLDDFRSYTFHYRNAKSAIDVRNTDRAYFCFDNPAGHIIPKENIRYGHMDDIKARGEIRLAMLDAQGNTIHISPVVRLEARKFMGYLDGALTYDGAEDTLEYGEETNTFGCTLYVILAGLGLLLTCLVERLVAVMMGLENTAAVVRVNRISQILMHVLYISLYSLIFWRYSVALVVLELLVYTGEFVCYRFWLMRELPAKKCLLFTVTANTVSLILGMTLLRIFGFLH